MDAAVRPTPTTPDRLHGWIRPRGEASLSDVHRSVAVEGRGTGWRKAAAFIGPGYLVAVGYMDPGNWATSLAGGAKFGYTLLAVILAVRGLIAAGRQALADGGAALEASARKLALRTGHLAEALYLDLHALGMGVSVVNPGFVATPLTAQNNFAMPALLSPDQAAQAILRGWDQGRFEIHLPKRFTAWLKLLSHLPHTLYFALVRRATGL